MHGMVTEVMQNHRAHPEIHNAVVRQVDAKREAAANTAEHQVYYVRVGDLIKIGVTRNLKLRLNSYPPGSKLLAVEPGGEAKEAERHRQFRHLLAARNEWFRPGADLMLHIAYVRDAQAAAA
jgi:hypothetical protein